MNKEAFPLITSAVHISDAGCLLCPRCGNEYLHHHTITVFDRREDGELTRVTTVQDGAADTTEFVPSCTVANPSSRQQGSRSPSGAKTAMASANLRLPSTRAGPPRMALGSQLAGAGMTKNRGSAAAAALAWVAARAGSQALLRQ